MKVAGEISLSRLRSLALHIDMGARKAQWFYGKEALTKPPYNFIPVNKDVPLPDYLPMKSLDEMASYVNHDWAKINPLRAGWIEKFNKEMAK